MIISGDKIKLSDRLSHTHTYLEDCEAYPEQVQVCVRYQSSDWLVEL